MLIYGKEIREKLKAEIQRALETNPATLTVVQVGDEGPSQAYVNGIKNFGRDVGAEVTVLNFPADISQEELLDHICRLNRDPAVTGIMIQKPLPAHINDDVVVSAMDHRKDVEGIHYYNMGRLFSKEEGVKPSTPKAVIRMLKEHGIEIERKKVTIVGRSAILGNPLAIMMTAENGTVTVCHTRTPDLRWEIQQADILVAAMGKLNFITADMVKEDCVIIDAGINFDENGKMFGDVDPAAKEKVRIASAVPGGVGVITVAELFDNLRILAEQNQ